MSGSVPVDLLTELPKVKRKAIGKLTCRIQVSPSRITAAYFILVTGCTATVRQFKKHSRSLISIKMHALYLIRHAVDDTMNNI